MIFKWRNKYCCDVMLRIEKQVVEKVMIDGELK